MKSLFLSLFILFFSFQSYANTNGSCYVFVSEHGVDNSKINSVSENRIAMKITLSGICEGDSIFLDPAVANPGCRLTHVFTLNNSGNYEDALTIEGLYYIYKSGYNSGEVIFEFEADDTVTTSMFNVEIKPRRYYPSHPLNGMGFYSRRLYFKHGVFNLFQIHNDLDKITGTIQGQNNIRVNFPMNISASYYSMKLFTKLGFVEGAIIDSMRLFSYSQSQILRDDTLYYGNIYRGDFTPHFYLTWTDMNLDSLVIPFETLMLDPNDGNSLKAIAKDTLIIRNLHTLTTENLDKVENKIIQLFPVPVKANSEVTMVASTSSEFKLYDTQGRIIQVGKLSVGHNKILMPNSGLYQLKVGESEFHKIVVE